MSVACLEPDEVEALLANGLDPADRERVDGHLDGCAGCRELLSHLAQLDATLPADPAITRDERGSALRVRGSRPIRIDRYIVDRKLGAGGMGVVFVAHDPELARAVVIKVLRRDGGDDGALDRHARMLREAQAMAKVSHPNVVPIYDVGEHDDQIYIVMELIDGADLGVWLRDKREVGEILDVFVAAGRGLAAAHRAGLVHRDFKPHNVMLANTGEVKVTDFGLARSELLATRREASVALLDSPITQDGAVVGTPAYMAPEQIRGEAVDARADQFSYCVALYEAFYGARPFAGRTTQEVLDSTLDGTLPAATVRGVPARVRRAIRRGLSVDPAARHASMDALLAELVPPKRTRLAIVAGIGVLAIGVGGVAFVMHGSGSDDLCSGAPGEIATVWNVPRRIAIERTFLATGLPTAASAFDATAGTIDAYAGSWAVTHRAACRATRVRGERSEAELDKRMYCLSRRRVELDALLGVLAKPDARTVDAADGGAHALPPPALCDRDTLVAPPTAAQRPEVDAITAEYAKANALASVVHFDEVRVVLEAALQRAKAANYLPLIAAIDLSLSGLDRTEQRYASADQHLAECMQVAEQLGDDETRAEAYLVYIDLDLGQRKLDEAERFANLAASVLHRLGDPPAELAALDLKLGSIAQQREDYAAAEKHDRSALARYSALEHPNPVDLGNVWQSIANVATARSDHEGAIDALHHEREQFAKAGKRALVAALDLQLAMQLSELHRYPDAVAAGDAGLAELRKLFPSDDNDMFITTAPLYAMVLVRAGRASDGAELADRAVAVTAKRFGERNPQYLGALQTRAFARWKAKRYDAAFADLDTSVRTMREASHPDFATIAELMRAMAFLRHEQQRLDDALAILAETRTVLDQHAKPRSATLAAVLTELGGIENDRGHAATARAALEEALAIRIAEHVPADTTGLTRFELARALWATDQRRAATLLDEAEAASQFDPDRLDRIAKFRAAHKR